jgi:hypothetical protein
MNQNIIVKDKVVKLIEIAISPKAQNDFSHQNSELISLSKTELQDDYSLSPFPLYNN